MQCFGDFTATSKAQDNFLKTKSYYVKSKVSLILSARAKS